MDKNKHGPYGGQGDPPKKVDSRGDPAVDHGSRGDPAIQIEVRGDPAMVYCKVNDAPGLLNNKEGPTRNACRWRIENVLKFNKIGDQEEAEWERSARRGRGYDGVKGRKNTRERLMIED